MIINLFIKIAKYPKTVVLLVMAASLFFWYEARYTLFTENYRLILDNSLEPFFSQDSDAFGFYRMINQEFGSDKTILLAIAKPSGMENLEFLLQLKKLEQTIEMEVPHLQNLTGPFNSPRVFGSCVGKSYFHALSPSSVCIDRLQSYIDEKNCIQSNHSQPRPPPESSSSLDLDLTTEKGSPWPSAAPPSQVKKTQAPSGYVCTRQIQNGNLKELTDKTRSFVDSVVLEMRKAPLIQRDLISIDGKTFGMIVQFENSSKEKLETSYSLLGKIIKRFNSSGSKIAYAGQLREEQEFERILRNDINKILPLGLLIILGIMFLFFRSLQGVVVPFLVLLASMIWTAGFFALTGGSLNLVTLVLPPVLVAVGSAYVVHFMNQYQLSAKRFEKNSFSIIRRMIEKIFLPLVLTAITTIFGFSALGFSPIPAIRQFGLYASFGIGIITLLSLLMIPSLVQLIPRFDFQSHLNKFRFFENALKVTSATVVKNSGSLLILWTVLGLWALGGIFWIETDSRLKSFDPNSSLMQEKEFIESSLGGTSFVRLVLSSEKDKKELQTKKTIEGINLLKIWLKEEYSRSARLQGVRFDKAYTPAEYLEIERQGLDGLKDEEVRSFFNRSKNWQTLPFLSEDQTLLVILLRLKVDSSKDFLDFKDLLETKAKEFLPQLNARITGSPILASESMENITKSQIISIAVALGFIFLVLTLFFLSIKIGLLVLYPNIVSVLIYFGILGWLQIPLGVTLSVIGSLAIGIGVDDTIHFVIHYNKNLAKLRDRKMAVVLTTRQIGKPMVYTTLALSAGFGVFALSELNAYILFGVLISFTLGVCLLADLFLLPAILFKSRLITALDYFKIPIDHEQLMKIELLRDLSLDEFKRLELFLGKRKFLHGQMVLSGEEEVAGIYIILRGEVEIIEQGSILGGVKSVTRLGFGKSFGKITPDNKRDTLYIAKVLCDSEMLYLNRSCLEELNRLYPKIANKLWMKIADTPDKPQPKKKNKQGMRIA